MNKDNPQEEINRSEERINDRRTECCELFHLNQITIAPDPNVQVEYLTIRNTLELYSRASGDVLLVKQQIGTQDMEWLKSYDGEKTVFTMRPKTLESLDALKECNGIAFLDSIDLNYLHFGEMLIVSAPQQGAPYTPPQGGQIPPYQQ